MRKATERMREATERLKQAAERLRRAAERRERGSVAVFSVVFAVAVVFLTALIVDGGIAMNAKERAADIAEQAARAAAGNIDIAQLRTAGVAAIGPDACGFAANLVSAYSQQDSSGVDRVTGATMTSCVAAAGTETATVAVTITIQSLVGGILGRFTESARETATAECGIALGAVC
jgi:Flp pilus assembly protein TadG